jgi:hypothetical protein
MNSNNPPAAAVPSRFAPITIDPTAANARPRISSGVRNRTTAFKATLCTPFDTPPMSQPIPAVTRNGNVAGISTPTPVVTAATAIAHATEDTVSSRAAILLPTRIPVIQQACIAPSTNSSPCSTYRTNAGSATLTTTTAPTQNDSPMTAVNSTASRRTCRMPASALGRASCAAEGLRSDRTNASSAA